MGVETELKQKQVRIAELEAETTKVQQIKQAEGEAQVHLLRAKGESDAMQYTLPLKEKQIQQCKLEAAARKEATIQNAEATAPAKAIYRPQGGERTAEVARGGGGGSHSRDGRRRCRAAIVAERLSDKLQIMMVSADGKFSFANDVLRSMSMANQTGQAKESSKIPTLAAKNAAIVGHPAQTPEAVSKQYRGRGPVMGATVYNLGIANVRANSVCRDRCPAHILRVVALSFIFLLLGLAITARAADWNEPEQQLAHKIVAVTGPGAVALTVENRSSLSKRDNEIIQNGLRSALEGLGIRFVNAEQAAANVAISLSENSASYVWVAQIGQSTSEATVVMVSAPRPGVRNAAYESVPLSLRKIPLWAQEDPILDVAVLEENSAATRIAVLDAEKVALYRWQGGKWQQEQALAIVHARPWPRDLRGRLLPAKDHLLDVYLPGVICRSAAALPLTLNCHETDDPWPLVPAALSGETFLAFPGSGLTSTAIPPIRAFYAPTGNFFTGVLTPSVGKFTTVPKFYSVAFLPRDKYLLRLFAATDGHVHMVDGVSDQAGRFGWGSDLTSLKTSCGSGWQVLATSSEETPGDRVRAYEFPDRDPVAVSVAVDFPGAGVVTALWTEAKGDTAIAVMKNRETGSYEAFRLAVVCSQ